jgi:hypothetical protein
MCFCLHWAAGPAKIKVSLFCKFAVSSEVSKEVALLETDVQKSGAAPPHDRTGRLYRAQN